VSAKILVVDDEARIVKLVRSYLEQAGYVVVEASDGQTALIQARRERPDLIVLDLGLPGIDGFEVARILRREGDTPIIMLTARIEDTDRIVGLELGADDYVTKPFNPRELVARVRAVLRRTSGTPPSGRSPRARPRTAPGSTRKRSWPGAATPSGSTPRPTPRPSAPTPGTPGCTTSAPRGRSAGSCGCSTA